MEQQSFKGHSASYILFYNNFHSFPQTLHRICSQRKATELKAVFINKLSMSRQIKLLLVPLATFYLRRCFAKMVLTSPVKYRIHILNKLRICICIENFSICCQILYLIMQIIYFFILFHAGVTDNAANERKAFDLLQLTRCKLAILSDYNRSSVHATDDRL